MNLRRARWSITFDPSGLSATDTRMLSAVVDADLQLMRLVEDPADPGSEEALVRKVMHALTAQFPNVAFRAVHFEEGGP